MTKYDNENIDADKKNRPRKTSLYVVCVEVR